MRLAELVMAIVMAVFSIYLMWLSTELDIGWIKGEECEALASRRARDS